MKDRITELEAKLAATETKADSAEKQAATAVQVAAAASPGAAAEKGVVTNGDVPLPLASTDGWWNRTSLGGYGEMHLTLGDKETIDYHRFVLMFDHEFNDRIRLVSEVEFEHSLIGEGKPGEVELEQAYLDFDMGNGLSVKAGLFLLPIGLLNETHEPTTYFGTERNFVDTEIIPTTWWEGGLSLTKRFDNGLSFDLAGHSGLDVPVSGSNAYRIRSGRKKVAEAPAGDWAGTFRAQYTGIPGLAIGSSLQYQSDISQTTSSEDNAAWLAAAHADWEWGGFGLRALYGHWNISGPTPAALGVDEQNGFYIEPSYTFLTAIGDIGVFARWSVLDSQRIDSNIYDVGFNYWPDENVVFKVDYTRIEDAIDQDFINVGMGFHF